MRQVVCVRAVRESVCEYVSVHTYALCSVPAVCLPPSMRPLLLRLVVVSVALPGCSALFSSAVADAQPPCLDTLAQLLAFCYSADGGA